MKKTGLYFLLCCVLAACSNTDSGKPDVTGVTINTKLQRFDEDFFSLDTAGIEKGLSNLHMKYPELLPVYLQNIVGVENNEGVIAFYRSYRPVFDSTQKLYRNFAPVQKQLEEAFRHVKYYFPSYTLPASIVPVVGPMNSRDDLARMANGEYTPNFIGPGLVGISLQFYLGKDFSFYSDPYFINNVAPLYRSRRFSKEYIAADVMKLVVDDLFPDQSAGRPLIDQMIEKGKQWWLIDKLMPGTPDSIKTGYTQEQLEWCNENEGMAWTQIAKSDDLRSINPNILQIYIGESPFTSVFDPVYSPGNIGPWFGRQIVRKFAQNNPSLKPEQIMQTTPDKILEGAKYKPK